MLGFIQLTKTLLNACRLHHSRYLQSACIQLHEMLQPEDLSNAILNISLALATQHIVPKIWDIAKAVERVMGTHEDEEAIIVHPCSGLHRAEAGASF